MEPIDENTGVDDFDDLSSEEMLSKPDAAQELEDLEAKGNSSEDFEDAGEDVTADKEDDQAGEPVRKSQDFVKGDDPAGHDASIGEDLRDILMATGPPSERHTSVTNNAEDDIAPLNDLGDVQEGSVVSSTAPVQSIDIDVDNPGGPDDESPKEAAAVQEASLDDEPDESPSIPAQSTQPDPDSEAPLPVSITGEETDEADVSRESVPLVPRESGLPSPPPSLMGYFGSPIQTGSHPVHETIDEEVPSDLMEAVNEMAPEESLTAAVTNAPPPPAGTLEDTPMEQKQPTDEDRADKSTESPPETTLVPETETAPTNNIPEAVPEGIPPLADPGSTLSPETSPPAESSPSVVPAESSPPVVPVESSPHVMPAEISPPVVPAESSPPVVPAESRPQVMPAEISPPDIPKEISPPDAPTESTPLVAPADSNPLVPGSFSAATAVKSPSSTPVSTPTKEMETPPARPPGPQGLPSLPARSPRPAGLGAGGLPPRPSAPRPTGMGAGLPPNPNAGARPQRSTGNQAGGLLVNPMAQLGNPVRATPVEDTPDVRETRQKLMDVRLKMLRIAARLELPHMDISVQEFMNKIDMTERVRYPRRDGNFRPQLDVLFNEAIQMNQVAGPDSDLGVSVTVLVIGPVDSGKTSLIRNLLHPGFGLTDDFAPGPTNKISTYSGDVMGVHFTFIDTPGLSMSSTSMYANMCILKRTREVVNRKKPDVVIYVDRLDVFRRELTDVPLLRLVNKMLPEMLYSAVVMLTRGCAPPPDNAETGMEYPDYYRHRLDVAGQVVSHAISDMRWGGRPMGFENHPNCALEDGVAVLPIGHPFKKQALYHLISSKMFEDIEEICNTRQMKRRTVFDLVRMVQPRRQLQLTALVSQLLASRSPKKFQEEERELKSRAELDEMDALTRQLEENKVRDYIRSRRVEQYQEEQHPTQVPVVATSLELNPSFDHEVTQHRYRGSDFVGAWSVRPIVSSPDGTYDHEDGIEMFQLARETVLRPKKQYLGGFPATMIVQVGKGKNALNLTMDTGISAYCGKKFVITANSVVHPAGQDGEFVYTPMVDFRLKTASWNKASLGLMACRLAESGWPHKGQLSYGAKVEEKVKIKEGVKVVTAVGVMTMKGVSNQPRDLAYGANADLKLTGGKGEFDPNFIIGVGMNHHKRGSINRRGYSGQISAEKALTRETIVSSRVSMNTGGTGQMTARMVTHDKPVWAWSMVVPLGVKLIKRLSGQGGDFA